MGHFEKAQPVYPSVTVNQHIDLPFLLEVADGLEKVGVTLLSLDTKKRFNTQLKELVELVVADGLLQRVENERIIMKADGEVTLTDLTLEESDES